MKPSRSSACAVVSKGMRESSHLQRSFAAGSSSGFGAGLVVMTFLRAGYSSTLTRRSHGETQEVLSSRYRRALRPLHIDRQDSRGHGHQDRAKDQAEHPKSPTPPTNTDENHQGTEFRAPASSKGRRTLSTIAETPAQITSRIMARPQCPENPSHKAAGTKIRPDPTTGTSEKKAMATPQKSGAGQADTHKTKSADGPLNGGEDQASGHAGGDEVARLRHQRIAMFRIERQNTSNSMNNLVRVSKEINTSRRSSRRDRK